MPLSVTYQYISILKGKLLVYELISQHYSEFYIAHASMKIQSCKQQQAIQT